MKTVEFGVVDEGVFDELVESVLTGAKKNRGALKTAEILLYAAKVSKLTLPRGNEEQDVAIS